MEAETKLSLKKPEKLTEDLTTWVSSLEEQIITIAALIDGIDLYKFSRRAVCAAPTKRSRAKEHDEKIQDNQSEKLDKDIRIKISKTDMDRIRAAATKKELNLDEFFRQAVVRAAWRHMLENKREAYVEAAKESFHADVDVIDILPQMEDWWLVPFKKELTKKS